MLDHAFNALRNRTSFGSRCSVQNSLLDFLTNLLLLSLRQLRTTLAPTTFAILTIFAFAFAITITVDVIVQHLVQKVLNIDVLNVLHEVVIDSLSSPVFILGFIQARNSSDELTDLVTLQVSINGVVISDVPDFRITIVTTTKMIVHNVQHFVTNEEFDFLRLEHVDETRVVIETLTVSCSSSQPFVSIDKRETSSKITEERMAKQKTDTSSDQTFTSNVIDLRISRTHKIFELLAARTLRLLRGSSISSHRRCLSVFV